MVVNFKYADTIAIIEKCVDQIPDGTFMFAKDNKRLYLKISGELVSITPKRTVHRVHCCSCGALLSEQDPNKYFVLVRCEYCGAVQYIELNDMNNI